MIWGGSPYFWKHPSVVEKHILSSESQAVLFYGPTNGGIGWASPKFQEGIYPQVNDHITGWNKKTCLIGNTSTQTGAPIFHCYCQP